MAKNISEIEAIAEPRRENPRVQVSVGADASAIPTDIRIDEGLLHVGVEIPAATERMRQACPLNPETIWADCSSPDGLAFLLEIRRVRNNQPLLRPCNEIVDLDQIGRDLPCTYQFAAFAVT